MMIILLIYLAPMFLNLQKQVTVFLAGDSTMSEKETSAYPETGWGMPFSYFFEQTVKVENHAKNGRSTSSFRKEGRWDVIMNRVSEGDFVFIQFGHNDEVQTKANSTKPEEYRQNLKNYISETRQKGATPVILTPVARRKFSANDIPEGTHDQYSAIVREVAATEKVFLIDHDRLSQQLLQEMGQESSKLLYNHLEPGEHPNYPSGVTDNTHFNELGARKMAQLVLKAIRESELELKNRIVAGRK
jgi:lysophospholipase L1-like esterase